MPELRFPEFRDSEGWREIALGKIISLKYGSPLPESARVGGSISVVGSNGIVGFHDVAITKGPTIVIGRKGSVGQVKWIDSDCFPIDTTFFVNNLAPGDFLMRFIFILLENCNLESLKDGGAIPGINRNSVYILKSFSPNPPEQQKIADCLSSIDNLITAQTKKIEVLKAHKKGLMQQLFPAEGETVPRLRFTEFRSAPEWKEKSLSEISPVIFDGTHQTPKYTTSGIPFFSVENLVSGAVNKYISQESYDFDTRKNKPCKGDILLTRIGKIGYSKLVDWDYDFAVYVTLAVIAQSESFSSRYLHFYLQSSFYQREILSKSLLNAVPCKINMGSLRETKVYLPPDLGEQEKIGVSLASLDDLIVLHTRKLEVLKANKKGLMQCLFPSTFEGEA